MSYCEHNAKHNTNQLTREEKKAAGEKCSGFPNGIEGAWGGDTSIMPPELRFHRAEPLLLARLSAFPLWKRLV